MQPTCCRGVVCEAASTWAAGIWCAEIPAVSAGPGPRGGSPSPHLSKIAMRVPDHLRLFCSCCLRDCIEAPRARCLGPGSGWRPCLFGVGLDGCTHVWLSAERFSHSPPVSLPWRAGGGVMNGTDAASDFSCCAVVPWLSEGGGGGAVVSGGYRIGAPRVHTCAGSCVWCLEAAVRVSRGHKSVPVYVCVCVGGAFQDGVVCEHGSRGQGLHLSGKGCVPVLRVLQSEQSSLSHALGPRTASQ